MFDFQTGGIRTSILFTFETFPESVILNSKRKSTTRYLRRREDFLSFDTVKGKGSATLAQLNDPFKRVIDKISTFGNDPPGAGGCFFWGEVLSSTEWAVVPKNS
ncbi:hypothetical protein NPIL_347821 [Nephila pilipes]|uniref:Uncharacterized protein n=1 Tax=Nephila pilipes TaxID=299642 RepID=A0A8X6UU83_NEPPI|nr:hypothetical protein NPIL_347821 [Nephila pilipes]